MAIQQIWLEQDFDQVTLETICGQQVKIEFAGWYNSASGPDFRADVSEELDVSQVTDEVLYTGLIEMQEL